MCRQCSRRQDGLRPRNMRLRLDLRLEIMNPSFVFKMHLKFSVDFQCELEVT